MKKAEILISIFSFIAFMCYILLIDGGEIFTTLILLFFSLFYLVCGFALLNRIQISNIFKKQSYYGLNILRIICSILIGFALSIAVLGVMYGLLTFAGVKVMLWKGLSALAIALLFISIEFIINKSDLYKSVLPRILIWSGLCLLLFEMPQSKILEFKYRKFPNYVQAIQNSLSDPTNKQLREKMEEERIKTTTKMDQEGDH